MEISVMHYDVTMKINFMFFFNKNKIYLLFKFNNACIYTNTGATVYMIIPKLINVFFIFILKYNY